MGLKKGDCDTHLNPTTLVPNRTARGVQSFTFDIEVSLWKDVCLSQIAKRAFVISTPTEWNKLPLVLKTKNIVDIFKVALKSYILMCL